MNLMEHFRSNSGMVLTHKKATGEKCHLSCSNLVKDVIFFLRYRRFIQRIFRIPLISSRKKFRSETFGEQLVHGRNVLLY